MQREEIETILTEKYARGEVDTGLIDTGLEYVVMDIVGDQPTFQWFESAESLQEILSDGSNEVVELPIRIGTWLRNKSTGEAVKVSEISKFMLNYKNADVDGEVEVGKVREYFDVLPGRPDDAEDWE